MPLSEVASFSDKWKSDKCKNADILVPINSSFLKLTIFLRLKIRLFEKLKQSERKSGYNEIWSV